MDGSIGAAGGSSLVRLPHAKAGNINHALTTTCADFVAMFDADFKYLKEGGKVRQGLGCGSR